MVRQLRVATAATNNDSRNVLEYLTAAYAAHLASAAAPSLLSSGVEA